MRAYAEGADTAWSRADLTERVSEYPPMITADGRGVRYREDWDHRLSHASSDKYDENLESERLLRAMLRVRERARQHPALTTRESLVVNASNVEIVDAISRQTVLNYRNDNVRRIAEMWSMYEKRDAEVDALDAYYNRLERDILELERQLRELRASITAEEETSTENARLRESRRENERKMRAMFGEVTNLRRVQRSVRELNAELRGKIAASEAELARLSNDSVNDARSEIKLRREIEESMDRLLANALERQTLSEPRPAERDYAFNERVNRDVMRMMGNLYSVLARATRRARVSAEGGNLALSSPEEEN